MEPRMPDKIEGLVGPSNAGDSYGATLEKLLAKKGLTTCLVASAYLTVEAAEHLLTCIYGILRKGKKPAVTVLVGTKDRFTRKDAIRRLLAFSKGGKYASDLPASLEVLCPLEPSFHVKAMHVRYGTKQWAVVGSHNLTGAGMDAVGELGVVLSGPRNGGIEQALGVWAKDSQPWTKVIKTYKEAKLRSGGSAGIGASGMSSDFPAATVGDEIEWVSELTKAQKRDCDQATDRYERSAPKMAERADRYDLLIGPREEYLQEGNLHRGALFASGPDHAEGTWSDGEKRAIRRVLDTVPTSGGKNCLLVSEKVIGFTVNADIRKFAEAHGLKKSRPEPRQMAAFIQHIKYLRRRKAK